MRSNLTNQSVQIAAQLLEKDGTYTMDGDPISFDHGYQVGGFHGGLVNPTLEQAARWVRDEQASLANGFPSPRYLGSWTDEQGNIYLDASTHIDRFNLAMSVAGIWREKAIWDWSNSEAIDV